MESATFFSSSFFFGGGGGFLWATSRSNLSQKGIPLNHNKSCLLACWLAAWLAGLLVWWCVCVGPVVLPFVPSVSLVCLCFLDHFLGFVFRQYSQSTASRNPRRTLLESSEPARKDKMYSSGGVEKTTRSSLSQTWASH